MTAPAGIYSDVRREQLFQNYRLSSKSGFCLSSGRKEAEKEAYVNASQALVLGLIGDGTLQDGDQENVTIHFSLSKQTAFYVDPRNNSRVEIDLLKIGGPVRDAIDAYMEAANAKLYQKATFAPYSIGNVKGKQPFQIATKKNQSLVRKTVQIIPKQLQMKATPEERKVIARRIHYVEAMQRNLKETLTEEKESRTESYRNALQANAPQQTLSEERRAIEVLKNQIEALGHLDLYALSIALSHYPIGQMSEESLQQAEQAMANQLREELNPGKSIMDRVLFRDAVLDERDEEYLHDVRSLFHSHSRTHFYDFAEGQKKPMKRESLEYLFFQEALRFAETPDGVDYEPTLFANSIVTVTGVRDLSLYLEGRWDMSGTAVGARILDQQTADYDIPSDYPPEADDKLKAQLDQERLAALKTAFSEDRSRILNP